MPKTKNNTPTVSRVLDDGRIVELIYTKEKQTKLAVWDGSQVTHHNSIIIPHGDTLVPVKQTNNLIRHKAVLLPSGVEVYDNTEMLLQAINTYLDRYVDLSDSFRKVAPIYVLLSWVYDAFNEVPYLRFRGDFGSGKTRALRVLGSILYKPIFASGASSISPIFHTLDLFKGSLVFDETDFRYSDERNDVVKIFNNGTSKGLPVLRTMVTKDNEYSPRAFSVYGPKVVAMRRNFQDDALESRFLTEDMGRRELREDIPISLPATYVGEAQRLRNMLLMFRFRTLHKVAVSGAKDATLSPRANQLYTPLLSLTDNNETRAAILECARDSEAQIHTKRSHTYEALLLPILLERMRVEGAVSIQTLTDLLNDRHGNTIERPTTPRYVGSLVRTRLYLPTHKTGGVYVISFTEVVQEQIRGLCRRYGVGTNTP